MSNVRVETLENHMWRIRFGIVPVSVSVEAMIQLYFSKMSYN